jgi:shikimate dehydrogenase
MLKLAVIGDPIQHSLSPVVHGAALESLGIPYTYQKVQVKKGELKEFLSYANKEGLTGFNLTMPHKVDILPYLDEIEETAAQIGAVNTVKIQDGRLLGFNTDGGGYTEALRSAGYAFAGKRVLILGAGGVVRTLALQVAKNGAQEIRILNRTVEKAEGICRLVQGKTVAERWTEETLFRGCETCDIFIQATPLGMHGTERDFEDLRFLSALPKTALVSDLIYNPKSTKLLTAAKNEGLATMNGLGMLIYQALLADRIYTGMDFDLEPVYQAIKKDTEI